MLSVHVSLTWAQSAFVNQRSVKIILHHHFLLSIFNKLSSFTDGLIDCADSEWCSRSECKDSLMCLSSPDPLDILLRKPPPSVTASFFQKVKFLIEEGSVQSYAHRDEYLDR